VELERERVLAPLVEVTVGERKKEMGEWGEGESGKEGGMEGGGNGGKRGAAAVKVAALVRSRRLCQSRPTPSQDMDEANSSGWSLKGLKCVINVSS